MKLNNKNSVYIMTNEKLNKQKGTGEGHCKWSTNPPSPQKTTNIKFF
jgi:hypothetical protein